MKARNEYYIKPKTEYLSFCPKRNVNLAVDPSGSKEEGIIYLKNFSFENICFKFRTQKGQNVSISARTGVLDPGQEQTIKVSVPKQEDPHFRAKIQLMATPLLNGEFHSDEDFTELIKRNGCDFLQVHNFCLRYFPEEVREEIHSRSNQAPTVKSTISVPVARDPTLEEETDEEGRPLSPVPTSLQRASRSKQAIVTHHYRQGTAIHKHRSPVQRTSPITAYNTNQTTKKPPCKIKSRSSKDSWSKSNMQYRRRYQPALVAHGTKFLDSDTSSSSLEPADIICQTTPKDAEQVVGPCTHQMGNILEPCLTSGVDDERPRRKLVGRLTYVHCILLSLALVFLLSFCSVLVVSRYRSRQTPLAELRNQLIVGRSSTHLGASHSETVLDDYMYRKFSRWCT